MESDQQIWIPMAYPARLNNFCLNFQKEREMNPYTIRS